MFCVSLAIFGFLAPQFAKNSLIFVGVLSILNSSSFSIKTLILGNLMQQNQRNGFEELTSEINLISTHIDQYKITVLISVKSCEDV